jgi:hypothetical protein
MVRRLLALLTVFVLTAALVACGNGNEEDVGADGATDGAAEPTEPDGAADPTGPGDEPTELPGERVDIFPDEGESLAVVAVAAGDTLNVRAGPGVDFDVVAELDPLATGIVAGGHNRSLDDGSIWAEVTVDGTTGWANTAFLAALGATDDITAQLYPSPADRPSAATMEELGERVAEDAAGPAVEGEAPITITVVAGPTVGDLGEITVDVTGFADDSVLGQRLVVFAQPDEGGQSFTVRTVESTTLCRRGVADGLCV